MATKTKGRKKKTTKAKKATSSMKTATKKAKAAPAKKATAKSDKPKRASAIDAAAQVLKSAGKPMRSQELIVAMAEQKLWTSPGGATPHATLYAAILREISNKGAAARFSKVERGLFAFNAKAKG